ncbi:PCRF domain-containing protein [Methylomonas koyamae]|uniref:PCRF domain-containing protein n=1 Tax=Methylomonas koyamae TaxID=702114 RepID=UPI000AB1F651
MQEINPIKYKIADLRERSAGLKNYLDFDSKSERLVEVLRELEDPAIWNKPEQAQAMGKERAMLEGIVNTIKDLEQGLNDAEELLAMAVEENDEDTVDTVAADLEATRNRSPIWNSSACSPARWTE